MLDFYLLAEHNKSAIPTLYLHYEFTNAAKETSAIHINLNSMEYQLVRNEKGDWDAVDATVSDSSDAT